MGSKAKLKHKQLSRASNHLKVMMFTGYSTLRKRRKRGENKEGQSCFVMSLNPGAKQAWHVGISLLCLARGLGSSKGFKLALVYRHSFVGRGIGNFLGLCLMI